jgi:hypothetical protein
VSRDARTESGVAEWASLLGARVPDARDDDATDD